MPVLETDFLKGLLDEKDRLHAPCERALHRLSSGEWFLASSALIELDLLLKKSGLSNAGRLEVFESLRGEFEPKVVLVVSHVVLSRAATIREKYPFRRFYFDSIHISVALLHDATIVSSDREFDRVTELKRIPLERL
jgi:predicted nucleic acid-binding protein